MFFMLPESIRYLARTGQFDQLIHMLQKIAKIKRNCLESSILITLPKNIMVFQQQNSSRDITWQSLLNLVLFSLLV